MSYSNIVRSEEYKRDLIGFIKTEYEIETLKLIPASRGFYGETWRLDANDKSYFVKLVYNTAHKIIYERSFHIIQHLCNHGIDFISRIVKTKNSSPYAKFDNAILGVFDWIDGENIETDATKIPEYQMLAKVYAVPSKGLNIPLEDFSGHSVDKFCEQWNALDDEQILTLLEKNRAKLEHRAERLKIFSKRCQNSDTKDFVITHGDAGGNLIVSGDKYFIVDWDHPILAPAERDAWVMCSKDWAQDAFHDALRQNNITYTLRPERLAYYCYYFFFFYLSAYLDDLTQADTIEEHINGWIEETIKYADSIP
ncbi:MAG: phosphotransferase [Alphaproteobacteria bacterium]|nr:phosphotransferase [Alphaproteobacteria bacterium]MCL2504841.1 phosphotransferase [Alphaproteobacteria bacterium]